MWMSFWIIMVCHLRTNTLSAEKTGSCNKAMGLESGTISDDAITSEVGNGAPSCRLNNPDGAWCFDKNSVVSSVAIINFDLTTEQFVSGLASQGPPTSVQPTSYNHIIAFVVSYSLDAKEWNDFNRDNLIFTADKNDTADAITYHVFSSIQLARHVRVNVTMIVSGMDTICLRLELFGCDVDVSPFSNILAATTTKGQILVSWQQPEAENVIDPNSDVISVGRFFPNSYVVTYRPLEGENAVVSTTTLEVLLDDVRLGATYSVELQCHIKGTVLECGSVTIEAYPPCPEEWSDGNEYHCFLLFENAESFPDILQKCLDSDSASQRLGPLGALVDENEEKFLSSRVLRPYSVKKFWLVGSACQDTGDCCETMTVQEDGTLERQECNPDEEKMVAVCVRDHKGEGAKLRVSSVEANGATSVTVEWRYEGRGWKTDELQVKLWTTDETKPSVLTFSTLRHRFQIQSLELSTVYSFLLRPAPNIRSDEKTNKVIIIEFLEDEQKYGAFLMPVTINVYLFPDGIIRIMWDEATALSSSSSTPVSRPAERYSIRHLSSSTNEPSDWIEEKSTEYRLTPVIMGTSYTFTLRCNFLGQDYDCAEAVVSTDPPSKVIRGDATKFVVYQMMEEGRKWVDAEEQCVLHSGHLVSLLNEKEDQEVLSILPTKDSLVWTGAKLSRTGSSYWTDGNQINYIPMAKNSGVTSSADACCKAFNDGGKLRVSGGDCREIIPFMCKFLPSELLHPPASVRVEDLKWSSLNLIWQNPPSLWLPTYYKVTVCFLKTDSCPTVLPEISDKTSLEMGNLRQFTEYTITVESVLEQLDLTALKRITVFTLPKVPVQRNISSDGVLTLNSRILVAMGREKETMTAKLIDVEDEATVIESATGPVTMVTMKGLTPGKTYRLELKTTDSTAPEWEHNFEITAVPTCVPDDVQLELSCYRMSEIDEDFSKSQQLCGEQKAKIWQPQSPENLATIRKGLASVSVKKENVWVDISKVRDNLDVSEACSTVGKEEECCYVSLSDDDTSKSVTCSCCDAKAFAVCEYEVRTNLGKVVEFVSQSVGNTTVTLSWKEPETSWNIQSYRVTWKKQNSQNDVKEKLVDNKEAALSELEIDTKYVISVAPYGTPFMETEYVEITITTLDPNPQLTVFIAEDGVVKVKSPKLQAKGRGNENVVIIVYDKIDGKGQSLTEAKGTANNVDIKGLSPGKEYDITMKPAKNEKDFEYSTSFKAYPSCKKPGQIQQGLSCIWVEEESTTWSEAFKLCKKQDGTLLDPSSKEEFDSLKTYLTSQGKSTVWVDITKEKMSSLKEGENSQCNRGENSADKGEGDALCCSYDILANGTIENLQCSCCEDKKAFACKSSTKIDLGEVADVKVLEVTQNSAKLSWDAPGNAWKSPSFLVTWKETESSRRRRRSTENRLIVDNPEATIGGLKPGTSYVMGVAPFVDDSTSGRTSEITILTRDDIVVAGLQESTCWLVIMKIVCCTLVILLVAFSVFIFLVTRMLHMDCLAHMCSEVALIGAYLCILVSSAQSYSIDDNCLRARPSLCIVTAVLIQFFFQTVFLFLLLECILICQLLKGFISRNVLKSPWTLLLIGWGIPAIVSIISAAVGSHEFTDGYDNCWLNMKGTALLPSVVPVIIFAALHLILILSALCTNHIPSDLQQLDHKRARAFMKTRWVSFALLVLTTISWNIGMFGSEKRDSTLIIVFVVFSILLGIAVPVLRIRSEDQIKDQLSHGLFSGLRSETTRVVSVTPEYDFSKEGELKSYAVRQTPPSTTSSRQSEFSKIYRQNETKNSAHYANQDSDKGLVWHR